jgi:hypothetical protein
MACLIRTGTYTAYCPEAGLAKAKAGAQIKWNQHCPRSGQHTGLRGRYRDTHDKLNLTTNNYEIE